MLEEGLPVLRIVNKSNLSCYGLKERQVCGVKLEIWIYLSSKDLFLSKNIFTADYFVFAFVV